MIRSIEQLGSILINDSGADDTNYEGEEFEEESPTKESTSAYYYDEFESEKEKSADNIESERQQYEEQWEDEVENESQHLTNGAHVVDNDEYSLPEKSAEEVEAERLKYEAQWEDEDNDILEKTKTAEEIEADRLRYEEQWEDEIVPDTGLRGDIPKPATGTSFAFSTMSFARDSLDPPESIVRGIAIAMAGKAAPQSSKIAVGSMASQPQRGIASDSGIPGASMPVSYAVSLESLNVDLIGMSEDKRNNDIKPLPDYLPNKLGYHVHISSGIPEHRGQYSRVEMVSATESQRLRDYMDRLEKNKNKFIAGVVDETATRPKDSTPILGTGRGTAAAGFTTAVLGHRAVSGLTSAVLGQSGIVGGARTGMTGRSDSGRGKDLVPVTAIDIDALKAEVVKSVAQLMEESNRKKKEEESFMKMATRRAVPVETCHGGLPRKALQRMLDPVDVEAATGIPRSDPDFEYAAEFVDREEILVKSSPDAAADLGGGRSSSGGDLRRPSTGFSLVTRPGVYLVKNQPLEADVMAKVVESKLTRTARDLQGRSSNNGTVSSAQAQSSSTGAAASRGAFEEDPKPILDSKIPKEPLAESTYDFNRPDLLRIGTKRGPLWDMAEEVYATFLSDLIDICRERASSSTTVEEMAMHRVLAEHVSACFTPSEKTSSVRETMIRAAEDVSLHHPFSKGVPKHLLTHLHKKRIQSLKDGNQNKENVSREITKAAATGPQDRKPSASRDGDEKRGQNNKPLIRSAWESTDTSNSNKYADKTTSQSSSRSNSPPTRQIHRVVATSNPLVRPATAPLPRSNARTATTGSRGTATKPRKSDGKLSRTATMAAQSGPAAGTAAVARKPPVPPATVQTKSGPSAPRNTGLR